MKKTQQTKDAPQAGTTARRAYVAPVVKAAGTLKIHFCSGINLWDGTGGTVQCK